MSMNFPKGQRAIAFDRATAFPLDANAYFESLSAAQTAAATAIEVGGSTSAYYFGQLIAVVENDVATLYIIEDDGEGVGALKRVGGLGDGNSIDIDSSTGAISIHGFTSAGNKNIPYKDTETGKVVWGPVEGLIPSAIVPVGDGKTITVSTDPEDETKKIISILGSGDAATDTVLRKKSDGTFEWIAVYSKTEADAITDAIESKIDTHIADTDNPHSVTAEQVGLGNVTNDAQVKRTEMGVASGVATLGEDGRVPSSQLPSFVDDVIEGYLYNGKFYKDSAHTEEITGEAGKIYVDLSTNKTYRWSGSQFTEIAQGLALGETEGTAYEGSKGAALATRMTAAEADIDALEADSHTHSNKDLLDTYTQTEADLADAVSKKHEHSNKTELDKIADGDKAKWDAYDSSKADKVASATSGNFAGLDANGNLTDSGSKAADFATAAQGTKADSAIQGVQVNSADLTPDANKKVNVTIATGGANGTLKVNGSDVAVKGLGSAAYTESSAYATAAQGAKADTAVQSVALASGTNNGTLKLTVDGNATDNVAVTGLGSAAFTESSAYATAAQGALADSAIQNLTIAGHALSKDSTSVTVAQLKSDLGLGSAAYADTDAFDAAGAASAVQGNTTTTVAGVESILSSHTGNTTVHITAEERTAWNGEIGAMAKATANETAIGVLNGDASTTGSVAKAVATAKSEVIGTSESAASTDTIKGAKKYADAAVATAVEGLAITDITNTAGKTVSKISEADGKVSAEFQDISITKSQVSDFAHNHDDDYYKKSETYTQAEVDAIVDDYIPLTQKGAASGVATLDANGKVPLSEIPDAILGQLTFGGTFDADGIATITNALKAKLSITDNTIQLVNSETDDKTQTPKEFGYKTLEGTYFIANATFTIAGTTFEVGDWLVSIGTAWKKIDNTDAVTGVKGSAESTYRIGNVSISAENIGLGNVDNTSDANKPVSTAQQAAIDAVSARVTTLEGKPAVDITSTQISNWDDANDKKHEHSNKSVLDGITSAKVSAWDAAEANVLEAVKVDGTALEISDKAVELPLALSNKIGLVKADESTLQVDANHVMSVKAVSTDLITQGTNTFVLNGGDSTTA